MAHVALNGRRVLVLDLGLDHTILQRVDGIVRATGLFSVPLVRVRSSASECASLKSAGTHLRPDSADLVLICAASGGLRLTRDYLSSWKEGGSTVPMILLLEPGCEGKESEFLSLNVEDFIFAPFRDCELVERMQRLVEPASPDERLAARLKETLGVQQFVGQSPALLKQLEKLPAIARAGASVLVNGETGTGKEVVARAIHYLSPRSGKPFLPMNCGALPCELVENELFGHQAGAYTGANTTVAGVIAEAEGGTLFLDEIDAMPLASQVKLLRFLQEHEFRPLGSTKARKCDVRVIAASNGNFEELLEKGKFRRDLYYRLNVIPITLPPLRDRSGDIPLLARHFAAKISAETRQAPKCFTSSAMRRLLLHHWPGNVRELENVVERAVVLTERSVIGPADLCLPSEPEPCETRSFSFLKARAVEQFERTQIQQFLFAHEGNITKAAKAAGKNRRAFWELMRKHSIAASQATRSAG